MLSTSPIKSSSKASNYYFCPDEYYFQDSIEQSWVGKGAQALGLEGDVDIEQFKALLDGALPNGQQLGRMQNGQLKHRPGFDLTFNAPKSVSLLAIMGKDDRLLKAHSLAVKGALNSVEQRCAQARVTKNGVTQFQTTNNLTIATFRHELSRAGDPHLHTHCIVMNATGCEDGKWRSLASNRDLNTQDRYGFWEQVIHHQRYYGLIYRAELAYQLTQLGYQIRKTGDHHFFEIAGVPQAAIDAFSQRRKAIEAYMSKQGQSSAKDAAFATLATRQAKKARNKEQLNQLWRERANYHGLNPEQVIKQAKSGDDMAKESEISDDLKQMVINVIDQLTQSTNVFSEQQIIQQVFSSQPKQLMRVSDLLAVIADLNKQNTLVTLPGDRSSYTTQALIKREQTLIKQVQDGKAALPPILPEAHLKKWLERNPDCNAFEEKVLLRIFATGHQFQGVLGSNSDAQARLIHHIKHLSTLAETEITLVSLAKTRAQQLSQVHDVSACTLYKWMKTMEKAQAQQRWGSNLHQSILMVDDAQLLPLSQLQQLMECSQQTKTRVIFFGDQHRLSSFNQVNALQLLNHTLPKTYLPNVKSADEDNTRFKPSKSKLSEDKIPASADANIIEAEGEQSCIRQIARHYAALQARGNEHTLIVMPSNALCDTMNAALRNVLQDQRLLSKQQYAVAIVHPTQKDKVSACSIAQGERLIWQESDYKLGLTRGEILEVTNITSEKMILRKADGNEIEHPIDDYQRLPLTYAYAVTPYRAVYQNPKTMIAYQPSFYQQSYASQVKQWYYQANRHYVYTDNKARYLENVDPKTHVQQTPLPIHEMMATQQKNDQSTPLVQNALHYAVAHLSEREAAFDEQSLKTAIFEKTLGKLNPEQFEALWKHQLLPEAKQKGLLLECKKDGYTMFTTPEALHLERGIMEMAKKGQGQCAPISHAQSIQPLLEKSSLNTDQQQALRLMMTHRHRFMLIQGVAGSGKTTTISVAQSMLTELKSNYRLLGLAPTHRAVGVLNERGIQAQTLQSYLKNYRLSQKNNDPKDNKKTIFVLDEASMVSNRQMYDFLKICHQTGARAIIMGDIRQLPAIDAGKAFALLLKLNLLIAELQQTERYVEGAPLKEAVSALYQDDVKAAFHQLNHDFHEVNPVLENIATMAEGYLETPQSERTKLQVITPSHSDRVLFNDMVRLGLKQKGELGSTSVQADVLINRNLTQAERSEIENYRIGDVLKFHQTYGLPIAKGDYLKVEALVPKSNALVFTDKKEHRYYWQLPRLEKNKNMNVEIYRPESREISVGDQINWMPSASLGHRSDKQLAVITQIEVNGQVHAKFADGEHITFDLSNPEHLHFDHAYAGTAHALQGITVDQVALSLRSSQKYLANQKTFLVAISRSTGHVHIHTDNQKRLLDRLISNRGDKTSSIEAMGELKQDKGKGLVIEGNDAKLLKNTNQSGNQSLMQYNASAFIQERLCQSLPSLLQTIMAEAPKRKTPQHDYYGHNKGSLAVTIGGDKQGLWYDFQTGQGGNLLQLIQMKLGLNFKQAVEYAAQQLGLSPENLKQSKVKSETTIRPITQKQKETFNQNEQHRIHYAQTLYAQSRPIAGTLAEQYLRIHRGIQGALPDSLRFHPHVYSKINNAVAPALLAVAKNQRGQVQAIQANFLNPDNATKANLPIQKQKFGVQKGARMTLQTQAHQASDIIFYAEGPETGLSILEAFPRAQVEVLLGSSQFKHIPHQQTANHIVLCLDHDKNNEAVSKMYNDVANALTQAGKQVWLAKPSVLGYDFNDLLIAQGRLAVYQNIINASLYAQGYPKKSPINLNKLIGQINHNHVDYDPSVLSKTNNIHLKSQVDNIAHHQARKKSLKSMSHPEHSNQILNVTLQETLEREQHRLRTHGFEKERE